MFFFSARKAVDVCWEVVRRQAAAMREKALAEEADERRCQEEATHAAALAEMELAKEQCRHKETEHAALSAASSLAVE